jgi:hypothetical protein
MSESAKSLTITTEPGPLGIYVDEVPGEEYFVVRGVKHDSPLNATLQAGDRLQKIDGIDVKGWSLEKFVAYCKEHKDHFKKLDILHHSPKKAARSFFNRRKTSPTKIIQHSASTKSSPTKQVKLTQPPMIAFQMLRPNPPEGYRRRVVEVPPGPMNILLDKLDGPNNAYITIVQVLEDSPFKDEINAGDLVEGADNLYRPVWDLEEFRTYITSRISRTRVLHLFTKNKSPTPSRTSVATTKTTLTPLPDIYNRFDAVGKQTAALQPRQNPPLVSSEIRHSAGTVAPATAPKKDDEGIYMVPACRTRK